MKQKPSISSARISTISYNYVSSLHPNKLKLIKMNAIKLMQAPERLNEIWKSIRKTDLVTNGSPNLSIFQSIFDENKRILDEVDLSDCLKI